MITPAKNKAKKEAMMEAMWKMKKLDIKKLKAAFDNGRAMVNLSLRSLR
jgi:hypothetical protein